MGSSVNGKQQGLTKRNWRAVNPMVRQGDFVPSETIFPLMHWRGAYRHYGFESHTIHKQKQFNMNITISYNGSTAICKVNGKPINKATVEEATYAFDAFRTIEKAYLRDK